MCSICYAGGDHDPFLNAFRMIEVITRQCFYLLVESIHFSTNRAHFVFSYEQTNKQNKQTSV